MLLANLNDIDAAALQQLCLDGCPESDTLDFKREPPGVGDEDKRELVKDVCALANASGGDLVYGVVDKEGRADSISPFAASISDTVQLRVRQLLDAGIEPRVQSIRTKLVNVGEGYVLIVRVPASFDGPHCIRQNAARRFVMRNGTTTSDLTLDQLRSAFGRAATLSDRARAFIGQRVQAVAERKSSARLLSDSPGSLVHLAPIAAFTGSGSVDLQAIYAGEYTKFHHDGWTSGFGPSFNLEGLVVHPGGRSLDGYYGYTHLFRTGAMEAASIAGREVAPVPGAPTKRILWANELTKFYRSNLRKFLDQARSWGLGGPAIVGFALIKVEGYQLNTALDYLSFGDTPSDRPTLILPDVWVESIETADVDDIVRPAMDVLWQAFGLMRCSHFDESSGRYIGKA